MATSIDIAASVSSQYVHSRFVNVRDLNDFDVARLHYRDDANDVAESVLRSSKIALSPFGLHNVSDYFTRKIKQTIVRKSFIARKYLEWDFSRVGEKDDFVAGENYAARVDNVNDVTVDTLFSNENLSKILDDVVCCIIDCWNKYFLLHRSTINWYVYVIFFLFVVDFFLIFFFVLFLGVNFVRAMSSN